MPDHREYAARRDYYRERYANDASVLERQKAHYKARRNKRRAIIARYKQMKGCEICGYNENPVALDLDHINPEDKEFSISMQLARVGWDRIRAEVRKCRVLCANCHRVETHG